MRLILLLGLAGLLALACPIARTQAQTSSGKPRPTLIVVPPPNAGSAQDSAGGVGTPPPTTVVVVPPPAGYKPDVAPRARITERDESKYGYYPPPSLKPKLKSGMLTTGIWITSWSYGLALIVGSTIAGGEGAQAQEVGVPLMVPVVGPFIAASNASRGRGALLAMGVSELIGAALLAGGLYKYRKSRDHARAQGYRVDLGKGKTLALDVTVSPALLGPKLDLRF